MLLLLFATFLVKVAATPGELFRGGGRFKNASTSSSMALSPDGLNLYVPESSGGTHCLRRYALPSLDTSELTCGLSSSVRGLVVSPDGLSLYASGGQSFTWWIMTFDRDPEDGSLTYIEDVGAGGTMGTMVVSPDGRNLYGVGTGELSNRRSLRAYARNEEGRLKFIADYEEVGYSNHAAYTAISSDGQVVYGLAYSDLSIYTRDADSGLLTFASTVRLSGTSPMAIIGEQLYMVGGGELSVYTQEDDSLVLLETHSAGFSSGTSVVLLAYEDSVTWVNQDTLFTYARDESTGSLTLISYITDDHSPSINALVGTEDRVYSGALVYVREPATKRPTSSGNQSSSTVVTACDLHLVDRESGSELGCTVDVGVDGARTYSCLSDDMQTTLEIDRVPFYAQPGVELLTVGWLDAHTRSYTRFTLGCQGAVDSLVCKDMITLNNTYGLTEHLAVYVASHFLTMCRGGQCCVVQGSDGGYCTPPGYTATATDECHSGWRLSSTFTGLEACMAELEESNEVGLRQMVSRFGGSSREYYNYDVEVTCSEQKRRR